MKQHKELHLTGYFDSNFGDDMMMKLVVQSLPDIIFVVENTIETPILTEPNVIKRSREDCALLEKLIIIGSGFMLNNSGAVKWELLELLRGRNPGDYCLGCNIEPLNSPLKRFIMSRKLNRFSLVTCRDKMSYKWLCDRTKRPIIHYAPDILFTIPEQWLPKNKSHELLGISLMHREGDAKDCAYYREMAKLADEWISKTEKGVILMAFDSGKEDDLFACNSVKALMKYPDRAEIIAHKDGTEIFAAYARCNKIISARFHGIVLALRMEIPVYPLIFREKARNLLEDVQYPFSACDLDSLDTKGILAFLEDSEQSFSVSQDIFESAKGHAEMLKQQIERTY